MNMDEIVAARIGSIVTNDTRIILAALENGTVNEFISRPRAQLVADCDAGKHWEALAEARTLFLMDMDTGAVHAA